MGMKALWFLCPVQRALWSWVLFLQGDLELCWPAWCSISPCSRGDPLQPARHLGKASGSTFQAIFGSALPSVSSLGGVPVCAWHYGIEHLATVAISFLLLCSANSAASITGIGFKRADNQYRCASVLSLSFWGPPVPGVGVPSRHHVHLWREGSGDFGKLAREGDLQGLCGLEVRRAYRCLSLESGASGVTGLPIPEDRRALDTDSCAWLAFACILAASVTVFL